MTLNAPAALTQTQALRGYAEMRGHASTFAAGVRGLDF